MRYTPASITRMEPNEIFVFGSNALGIHGKGAALTAKELFGAVQGVGSGPTGRCYAIATKAEPYKMMPLANIEQQVKLFLLYARVRPHQTFLVTVLGCGLAGYDSKTIAPLFFKDGLPANITLPAEFHQAWALVSTGR